MISDGLANGGHVIIDTKSVSSDGNSSFKVHSDQDYTVHMNHAYVVDHLEYNGDGSVKSVVLMNPWGATDQDDPFRITVPFANFKDVFTNVTSFRLENED